MALDQTLLLTFLAVVDERGFQAAARRLGCVQSNVTARIKRLEADLGERLFERGRAGIALTAYGAAIEPKVRDLISNADAAERALRGIAGQAVPLRLGALETTAATRLPELFAKLRLRRPDAQISVRTGPTPFLLNLVWRHHLDAALVAGPVDPDRFASRPAFHETLMALGGASSADPTTLFAFPRGCVYRERAESWLAAIGREATVTEMGSLDGMIGCAAAGLGMVVVPGSVVAGRDTGRLAPTPLPREFGVVATTLVWRHDAAKSETRAALASLLGERNG